MQKVKVISLILIGFLLAILVNYLFKPQLNLDKQVLSVAISDTQTVVGYRNNQGGATTGFSYYFYFKPSNGQQLATPFLITDTSEVKIEVKGVNHFSLHVAGKVHQFTNNIWLPEPGTLVPVQIEFSANNQPSGKHSVVDLS
ncbi:hypothetical protein [Serratia microhaemolytica]|uniref:hypothetical protein n=1 Tax=Serratia microhaemolytica TaxID=2675110 RepID=UPI000FDDAA6A|nr:hypothetical protein [Serratia microhaemolytica]